MSRLLAGLVLCASLGTAAAQATPPAVVASDPMDGFKITPSMLTVNSADPAKKDSKTTPGLEFEYHRTLGVAEEAAPSGWAGSIAASGKIAFDHQQNVGDLIDLNTDFSYRHRFLPTVSANFEQLSGWGYLKAGIKGGIQANQSFDTNQKVLALETMAFYSPLRAPAFAVNLLPALTFGYERVKPDGDAARAKVDPSLAAFNRFHAKLSSSVFVGTISGGRRVKLEFKIDHWRERTASAAIAGAGLDRQTYRALALRESASGDDAGWSITYASGTVPTDKVAAKVWQVGYTFVGKGL